MSESTTWKPAVAFHFRVTFNLDSGSVAHSYSDVSGLKQAIIYKEQAQQGNNVVWLPDKVSYDDIVLKRALEPTPTTVDTWINECFKFADTGRIKPCKTMLISLLDEKSNPIISWECHNVVPESWSLGNLNAATSNLAIETLVLKHSGVKRK